MVALRGMLGKRIALKGVDGALMSRDVLGSLRRNLGPMENDMEEGGFSPHGVHGASYSMPS